MGLSIISSTSASINLSASPVAADITEGLPGEFASLLSGQTFATLISTSGINNPSDIGLKEPRQKDAQTEPSENAITQALPMDPAALVAMLGNPHSQLESMPRTTGSTDLPLERAQTQASRPQDISPASLAGIETLAPPQKSQSTQEFTTAPVMVSVGDKADTGALPDKAAIIAAEHAENAGENNSLATGLTVATQHRGIPPTDPTSTLKPTHTEVWPQQFSEKIVWMAKHDQQTAQINITPPQLGPVQITLNLNGDNASAIFSSPHPEVRQIIENSLPQLREMLASTGISLGEANVSGNPAQQNQHNPFMMANKNQSTHENAILPANDAVPMTSSGQVPKAGRGLVDLFA